MPRKGQRKRWFWKCSHVGCGAKSRIGYTTRAEAFDAARKHEHVSTTWWPYIWSKFQ